MNLPPVPGSSLPPPPPPPPPGANLPLPPPPRGGASRPALSRRAKIVLSVGAVVLTAFAVIAGLRAPPSDEAVRSFVTDRLARDGFDVQNYYETNRVTAPDQITVTANVTGSRRAGTGYMEIVPDASGGVGGIPGVGPSSPAEGAPPFDFAEWWRIRELLTGKNGPRLIELSGLGAEASNLTNVTLVAEVPLADVPPQLIATVRAERGLIRWKFSLLESKAPGPGGDDRLRPLAAFPGKVIVVNRPSDRDQLAALGRRLPDLGARLDQAIATLLTEKKSSLLALLKPQALFAGTAETKTEKARIFLEITEVRVDEAPPHLSVLLRNDGSWKEKRLFSGPLAYDTASGNFQLRLTSPAPEEPDASLAGPFFDNNIPFGLSRDSDGDSVLTLTIEGGALTWESDVAKLRLEPVREDARAGLVAEAQADGAKLLEATKVGAIYTGTITNKAKGTKGNWLLRFTKQEETTGDDKSGATLTAVLEHMEHTAWKCVLQGPLVTNRYRANGVPVHLDQQPSDHTPPKEVTDIFENRRDSNEESDSAMWLRFDGGRLVGENARFVFRFEPATGEFLAEREKKQAASSKP